MGSFPSGPDPKQHSLRQHPPCPCCIVAQPHHIPPVCIHSTRSPVHPCSKTSEGVLPPRCPHGPNLASRTRTNELRLTDGGRVSSCLRPRLPDLGLVNAASWSASSSTGTGAAEGEASLTRMFVGAECCIAPGERPGVHDVRSLAGLPSPPFPLNATGERGDTQHLALRP